MPDGVIQRHKIKPDHLWEHDLFVDLSPDQGLSTLPINYGPTVNYYALPAASFKDQKYIGAVGPIIGNPFQSGGAFRGDDVLRSFADDLLTTVAGQELDTDETEK